MITTVLLRSYLVVFGDLYTPVPRALNTGCDDNYKSSKEKLSKEWHGSVRSAGILPAVSLSSLSRVDGGSHDILKNVKFYDGPFIGGTRQVKSDPETSLTYLLCG